MKIRFGLIVISFLVLSLSGMRSNAGDREVIEGLPHGLLNWSQGLLIVKSVLEAGLPPEAFPLTELELRDDIARKLFQSLGHIRVDGRRSLSDLIGSNFEILEKLAKIAQAAPIQSLDMQPDGSVEMAIQVPLFGGLSQLMLPGDIKQVESIRAVGNGKAKNTAVETSHKNPGGEASGDVFTGLIVDARGIGAQAAMVPVLVDEDNVEVYGAAFVSREFAVQQGLTGYSRAMEEADHRRVGRNPLLVKGLRTAPRGLCDIVISNADAARLRSASDHLTFLKQCRVVILLD